ncbi:response regulator transcription factor [Clostridium diolis]|nr:response regulator [Clostridium diolis]
MENRLADRLVIYLIVSKLGGKYKLYKILAVDDREIFLTELKRLKLWDKKSEFKIVDTASNGKEALELLCRNSYDLVLTDIRMPVIDGLQLLREIQKDKLCPCVVILSEYSEFNYARQGIVLGAFDYLVKPVNEESMTKLLERTKKFLDDIRNEAHKPLSNIRDMSDLIKDNSEWVYLAADEKQIIKKLINKEDYALKLFSITTENIYKALFNDIIKADIVIKKMYHNIIAGVYENFSWLNDYICIEYFETIDYINEEDSSNFIEFYCTKITYLLDFLKKFYIEASDELIKNICEYILKNHNSDLKLKVIAEKFYINNTYLSNNFATKTGTRFNDYVTMVKMARARYLLINTQLKNYEVGYQLGYHDINYFSKLFKKYYGENPSNYRNNLKGEDYLKI